MRKQISSKTISLAFGILVVCFAVGFYAMALWQEPNEEAPEGNAPTPVNTGTQSQSKAGMISATQFGDADDPDYYLNPSGDSQVSGNITVGNQICLGGICKNSWPATGGVIVTYKMTTQSYKLGNTYYGKTVSYSCPSGADAVQTYCKEINQTDSCDGEIDRYCQCTISGGTASVTSYAKKYYGSYAGCYQAPVAVCEPYSGSFSEISCELMGPCEMQFQCGITETVGN